jgi:deoxyribodipyrimidine photo-lyase
VRTGIWWIRRDLRLRDNGALRALLETHDRAIPSFILDPRLLSSRYVGAKRKEFLFGGLRALDRSLRERGSRLIVREGEPERVLGRLLRETGADSIVVEKDVSPYARRRDQRIASRLPLRGIWGSSLLTPRDVLKSDGSPYTTFTPYLRAWKRVADARSNGSMPAAFPIPRMPAVPALESLPIPACDPSAAVLSFAPGEAAAEASLLRFLREGLYSYEETRNRLDLEGTSRLSPYLRFGMISARRVLAAVRRGIDEAPGKRERASAESFLSELVWREFYISILFHFPRVRVESFRRETRDLAWRDDEEGFQAWCEGRTGYPIVDAAMRELRATGFMHNRTRMVTAAFLTKHLLIDWRRGEEWFMKHLVDGDPAANNGGWQWAAGTGTDAAPYFRVFNPTLQGRRFDPEGVYVRRYLPELEGVGPREIHEPRRPIVSHTAARVRALQAFERARRTARSSSDAAPEGRGQRPSLDDDP